MVLPVFAFAFDAVGVGECGLDDDEGGQEADEAEEGHKDVGSGDFHVGGLTKDSIAEKPPEETPEWSVYEVAQQVRNGGRVDEFGGCWRGVTVPVVLGPFEEGLLKVEAFAECGVVEVDD